jgi:hypothetical protein
MNAPGFTAEATLSKRMDYTVRIASRTLEARSRIVPARGGEGSQTPQECAQECMDTCIDNGRTSTQCQNDCRKMCNPLPDYSDRSAGGALLTGTANTPAYAQEGCEQWGGDASRCDRNGPRYSYWEECRWYNKNNPDCECVDIGMGVYQCCPPKCLSPIFCKTYKGHCTGTPPWLSYQGPAPTSCVTTERGHTKCVTGWNQYPQVKECNRGMDTEEGRFCLTDEMMF